MRRDSERLLSRRGLFCAGFAIAFVVGFAPVFVVMCLFQLLLIVLIGAAAMLPLICDTYTHMPVTPRPAARHTLRRLFCTALVTHRPAPAAPICDRPCHTRCPFLRAGLRADL